MCNCCYEVFHNFIINYHAWLNKRIKKKLEETKLLDFSDCFSSRNLDEVIPA